MSIDAGDFKTGLTLLIDGNVWQVLDFMHVKPGKGAAILRTKMKNLKTGAIQERNFNPNTKFEAAIVSKKTVQYSYNSGDVYYFMDMETYDTYEVSEEQVGYNKNFLIEGESLSMRLWETEIIGIDLPEKMDFVIADTTDPIPGAKSTDTKDATLETGFVVKVPPFINKGEKITVNTVDGKYCGRA